MKMKATSSLVITVAFASPFCATSFLPTSFVSTPSSIRPTDGCGGSFRIFASDTKEKEVTIASTDGDVSVDPDAEGLPWWWDYIWKLPQMQPGAPGTECTFPDSANVLKSNIEQIYGGFPSLDGCPLAEGDITDIGDGK